MAQPVHKPGADREKVDVDQQWMSVEILCILIERRLAASDSNEFERARPPSVLSRQAKGSCLE